MEQVQESMPEVVENSVLETLDTPDSAIEPVSTIPIAAEPKLSKELQTFLKKESEFRKREDVYKAQSEQMRQSLENYKALEQRGKEDPEYILSQLGWDHDRISNWRQKNPIKSPEIAELHDKIAHLSSALEERDARIEKREHERSLSEKELSFKSKLNNYIENNLDEFELVSSFKKQDSVYDLIKEHWKETRQVLSLAQAAQEIEERLKSEYEPVLENLKKSKKFSKLFSGSNSIVTSKSVEDSGLTKEEYDRRGSANFKMPSQPKTITGKDVGSAKASDPVPKKYQSKQDRIAEIVANLKNKS